MNWAPIFLTLKLALVTTLCLLLVGVPIALLLSRSNSKVKPLIESLVSLPLVLPPTVLGFYLLVAFSPQNSFGQWLENTLGLSFVFSFPGLVLASIIYSLPFMVQPVQAGLQAIPQRYIDSAMLMGKSPWQILTKVQLPIVKTSLLSGIVLSFAHTIGEFGLVLMIGGNIPGETKVASIAIYDHVEALNYAAANQYSVLLLVISFATLLLVYSLKGGFLKQKMPW